MKNLQRLTVFLIAVSCFCAVSAQAEGQMNLATARQDNMKLLASKMGTIMKMLRGDVKYKSQIVLHATDEMLRQSGGKLSSQYRTEVNKTSVLPSENSRVKANIVTDFEKFEKQAENLEIRLSDFKKFVVVSSKTGLIEKAQTSVGRGSFEDYNRGAMREAMQEIAVLREKFTSIVDVCRSCHLHFLKPPAPQKK